MLISPAFAQENETIAITTDGLTAAAGAVPAAPSAGEAFAWNMGLVLVLVVMFYFLLIRPQQSRFKEHRQMLQALKKGDKVVTGGGLVGTVHKIIDEKDEVIVDLGDGLKVTALRSTLHGKDDALLRTKPANDAKVKS